VCFAKVNLKEKGVIICGKTGFFYDILYDPNEKSHIHASHCTSYENQY